MDMLKARNKFNQSKNNRSVQNRLIFQFRNPNKLGQFNNLSPTNNMLSTTLQTRNRSSVTRDDSSNHGISQSNFTFARPAHKPSISSTFAAKKTELNE